MSANAGVGFNVVLIVEDDDAMRGRLVRVLRESAPGDPRVVCAASVAGARASIAENVPDVALIDIGLPDGNGVELIAWLYAEYPAVTTVVVSAWRDEATVLAALKAGAAGYLLKDHEDVELELALQSMRNGGAPIDPFVAKYILSFLPRTIDGSVAQAERRVLSEREDEILGLVARGYSNREIAELTKLSRFTIESHVKAIYRKLAVGSRTAAVFEAKSLGLLR